MLRIAPSLPHTGLLTLGSDAGRFPAAPPACYRASWQLPGPDFHRQATTSLRIQRSPPWHYVTVSPPALLGARKRLTASRPSPECCYACRLKFSTNSQRVSDILQFIVAYVGHPSVGHLPHAELRTVASQAASPRIRLTVWIINVPG
jgi:hypothetical protein